MTTRNSTRSKPQSEETTKTEPEENQPEEASTSASLHCGFCDWQAPYGDGQLPQAQQLLSRHEQADHIEEFETGEERRTRLLKSLWKTTPPEFVGKLSRYTGSKDVPRNQRERRQCNECHSFHDFPAIHLDYLGHADTTRFVAEVDPFWQWEPRAGWDEFGEPIFVRDQNGYPYKLWINLTVLGVSRPGVGTVERGKSDPEKELIGDAIRNAAMRFGVAADLWSKAVGDVDDDKESPVSRERPKKQTEDEKAQADGWEDATSRDQAAEAFRESFNRLEPEQKNAVIQWRRKHGLAPANNPQKAWAAMGFMALGCDPDTDVAVATKLGETGELPPEAVAPPEPDPEPSAAETPAEPESDDPSAPEEGPALSVVPDEPNEVAKDDAERENETDAEQPKEYADNDPERPF